MTDKERLENMSPIGFDLDGNLLLKSEDYHWLMEQVERVEELEEHVKDLKIMLKVLGRQTERYKQALENITISPIPLEIDDAVNIARQALESDEN